MVGADGRRVGRRLDLHLAAENRAASTRGVYRQALTQFAAFLAAQGMPSQVASIHREHIEAFVLDALSRRSAARRLSASTVCGGSSASWDSGMRLGVMVGLRLGDLDLDMLTATVTEKGSCVRTSPFGLRTAQALRRYLRMRARHRDAASEMLRLGKLGPMGRGDQADRRAAGPGAGIRGLHAHQFRHTFAHNWLSNGARKGTRRAPTSTPAASPRCSSSSADQPRQICRSVPGPQRGEGRLTRHQHPRHLTRGAVSRWITGGVVMGALRCRDLASAVVRGELAHR